MDKIYIVLVGQDDKDIESAHMTIKGANCVIEGMRKAYIENNIEVCDILYDNRGAAYFADCSVWICEVDVEK